jgi:hypothetical protein
MRGTPYDIDRLRNARKVLSGLDRPTVATLLERGFLDVKLPTFVWVLDRYLTLYDTGYGRSAIVTMLADELHSSERYVYLMLSKLTNT